MPEKDEKRRGIVFGYKAFSTFFGGVLLLAGISTLRADLMDWYKWLIEWADTWAKSWLLIFFGAILLIGPWIPWRKIVRKTESDSPKENVPSGLRKVEKSRGVNSANEMIQDLIELVPSLDPLNRKAVANWSIKCIETLRAWLDDEYSDEWAKILALMYGVTDPKVDTATEVRNNVEKILIHLRVLKERFHEKMIRRKYTISDSEYSRLYRDFKTESGD